MSCVANSWCSRRCDTYHEECVRHAHRGQNTILLLEILYKPFEPPLPSSVRLRALRYERSALGCARPEISAARRCGSEATDGAAMQKKVIVCVLPQPSMPRSPEKPMTKRMNERAVMVAAKCKSQLSSAVHEYL